MFAALGPSILPEVSDFNPTYSPIGCSGTHKLVPDGGEDFLVSAAEPVDLPHVDPLLVELCHRLCDVVLRHDSLVEL